MQILKMVLGKYLSRKGLTIVRLTDKKMLISLIKSLHPFCTDKNLIRLGTNGDGGYLLPDDLEGISTCFSPGVGDVLSFEEDCLKHGMAIFLADKSVDESVIRNKSFNFTKKFIGAITEKDYITMDDWVNDSTEEKDSDLLLQMDIEGSEYYSIMNMSEGLLKRFRILVIEFHQLEKLWIDDFFELGKIVFQKILQNHTCVHIHPNNCCGVYKKLGVEIPRVAEFTFLRTDRINSKIPQNTFPNKLDFDCTNKPPIILPNCWYNYK